MGVIEKDFSSEREKYIRDLEEKNSLVAKDLSFLHESGGARSPVVEVRRFALY